MVFLKWIALAALVLVAGVTLVVLLRQDAPRIRYFRLMGAASAIYLLGYFLEICAPSYDAAYYAVVIEYLGVPYVAPWTMLFILDLHNHKIGRAHALLFTYPILESVLVITWPWNGLFYSGAHFEPGPPLSYLHVESTIFHTLAFMYMFALLLVAVVLVVWHIRREGRVSLRRELLVLAALASPFVGLVLYFTGIVPYDTTPIGIAVTACIIFYTVFRYNQLDLLPLAKGQMLDQMKDAYLVVDDDWHFFDANRQARALFPALDSVVYGGSLLTASENLAAVKGALDTQGMLKIESGTAARYYRPSRTEVRLGGKKVCSCILLYEATDTWQAMDRLQQQATYDHLTGVYNRGTYTRLAEMVFAAAQAEHQPLTVLVIDLDHFKDVNDTWGHLCGDAVLREVAQRISCRLRQRDVFGRCGGEEFYACLRNLGGDTALAVADDLRRIVAEKPVDYQGAEVHITVSIGMCVCDGRSATTMEEVVAAADRALYAAKDGGRNRVRQASPTLVT